MGSKRGLLDKKGRICDEKKAFSMDVPWSYSGAREPVLVFINAKGQWGSQNKSTMPILATETMAN